MPESGEFVAQRQARSTSILHPRPHFFIWHEVSESPLFSCYIWDALAFAHAARRETFTDEVWLVFVCLGRQTCCEACCIEKTWHYSAHYKGLGV